MTPPDFVFTSDLVVKSIRVCAEDVDVIAAAQISTKGDAVLEEFLDTDGTPMSADRFLGMLNFLMRNRHGSVFEHNYFRFFVSAPIAVFREFHRHRIGFSYNEASGRYSKMKPKFYVPPAHRPLVQVGKPGHYTYVPGTVDQHQRQVNRIMRVGRFTYEEYEDALKDGIAREVARGVLPVYLYSSMWVSCNARSMMSFLSLRTTTGGFVDMFGQEFDAPEEPLFPSYPMWEIEQVALQMEHTFARAMPLTHAAFRKHRSVAP